MKPLQNQQYINGLLSGDPRVLKSIYTNCSTIVLKYVLEHHGTTEDAKDVLQESLLIICKNIRQTDFQLTCKFFTYFYAICRNVWRKMLEKRKFQRITIDGDLELIDDTDTEQILLNQERYQFYLNKLNELSPQTRQLLELHFKGKSIPEIVAIMGFSSEGYARKRKYLCKQQLIKRIKADNRYLELIAPN